MRTRSLALAAAALTIAPLLNVLGSSPASAAVCSPRTANFIGGTISGQDGRDINAQVSLDVVDRTGAHLDLNGCRTSGYTKTIWMNMNVSGNGVVHTAATRNTWRLDGLPANASSVWIEVWTRTNTPKPCPTCDGPLDTHRYGFVNRRAVKLNTGNVRLLAPLHCKLGGQTGNIQGTLTNKAGKPVKFDSIYAWSMLTPDGSKPLQGWGAAVQSTGYYVIDTLASGQTYAVWASYRGVTFKRLNVPVKPCGNTPLRFAGAS
jgi:hypothetical protein